MPERLRYISTSIVLQEVPDEISLAISISGCTHKCDGCHSAYLWENKGKYLTDNIVDTITSMTTLAFQLIYLEPLYNPFLTR